MPVFLIVDTRHVIVDQRANATADRGGGAPTGAARARGGAWSSVTSRPDGYVADLTIRHCPNPAMGTDMFYFGHVPIYTYDLSLLTGHF